MRRDRSSLTAIGIAIVRAIESERPAEERICYDPYARQFVSGFFFHLVRLFEKLGYAEIRGPGVMGFLTARERHIDEFLQANLAKGLEQLVILGAGLDARAYRFEQLSRGVRVFEVDHPASQRSKIARVKKVFGQLPAHVTYVAVDFNSQALGERLLESGYDESRKTLFIWQGVTQYLTPAAVDATLACIAAHSPAGSAVIFDYMYPTLLDGTIRRGEVAKMRGDPWLSQEALVFGIPEGTATEFLEQRGFTDVRDADHAVLQRTCFQGPAAKRTVAYGYAIVSAVVGPPPQRRAAANEKGP